MEFDMANGVRYHYNSETGQVRVCRANNKCPLGTSTPHFNNENEAKNYAEQIEAINNPKFSTVEKSKLISKVIKKDLENFKNEIVEQYGELAEVSWHNPDVFDDFLYLGKGAEVNVYLSPNDKFVYKVPNDYDREYDFLEKYEISKEDEELYNNLDRDFLKNHNCEYVETAFIEVCDEKDNRMIMIVQPYLNDGDYENLEESPFEDEDGNRTDLGELFSQKGYDDLAIENIKRRKSDGSLILFDCIA